MLLCPNGHGPKEGRFCPECGAALVAVPPSTGDAINIRSPQAQAVAAPTFVLPGGVVETRPGYVICPQCGRRRLEPDTFDCRGECGRQNLCLDHFDKEFQVCDKCASVRRGDAEGEEKRWRAQQADLEHWRQQVGQAEKQVAELTRQEQQSRAAVAQAQADLQQARERVKELEQELVEWRGRAERAEAALTQATTERDRWARELEEAQARLHQAEQAAAAATADWQARVAALEKALAEWRGRAERAEAQLVATARKKREAKDARREAEEARQHNELELELAPRVTMAFVRVPAGEFLMGSDKAKNPDSFDNELPQHRVYLDEYWIGKYPVTVAQFAVFVEATAYETTAEKQGGGWVWTLDKYEKIKGAYWRQPKGPESDVRGKADHPVTQVSWYDAMAFCKWASQITGRIIRLPTEAEWEKAARGGLPSLSGDEIQGVRAYPWGDHLPSATLCNFNNHVGDTTPVGRYSPAGDSPYGCADMVGNVWEWCADWYGERYYDAAPWRNPTGPTSGRHRVVRGGSWLNDRQGVRAAYRYRNAPLFCNVNIGFRCVLAD